MSMTKMKLFRVTFEPCIHIKCNNLSYLEYRYFQNCDESWYCKECCNTIFPFNSYLVTKTSWFVVLVLIVNIMQWKELENDHNSSLSLKPSPNLELLVNQLNTATPENINYPEKTYSFKYYGTEEMHKIQTPHKNKSLSMFYINACSLNKSFDYLCTGCSTRGTSHCSCS